MESTPVYVICSQGQDEMVAQSPEVTASSVVFGIIPRKVMPVSHVSDMTAVTRSCKHAERGAEAGR